MVAAAIALAVVWLGIALLAEFLRWVEER